MVEFAYNKALKQGAHGHAHLRSDSFQNKLYEPKLNLKKTSTANRKKKCAHPLLYVSKVKSAIFKVLLCVA